MKELQEKLRIWLDKNHLQADFFDERVFKIGDDSFLLLPERGRKNSPIESVFTEDFELNITPSDEEFAKKINVKNYCFLFGNNFYFTPEHTVEKPKLNILKYIGESKKELDLDYTFLGMRGKFELCNGSGHYKDWISKAKFLGVKALGIAEHNTLAGTLPFQTDCQKSGLKFILGETITVRTTDFKEFLVKLYVLNQEGWFNLLQINKIINVDNVETQHIDESILLEHGSGLVGIFDPESPLTIERINDFKRSFSKVFFQVDMTQYKGYEKEKTRLLSQKYYFENFISLIEPILIQDAFYLDREFSHIKPLLNKMGGVKFQFESKDQWFKTLDEIFLQWSTLFSDSDENKLYTIFMTSIENTNWIAENSNYEIETGVRHLPKFEWDGEEENEDLFFRLIGEGMERKGLSDKPEYWDRIEKEVTVIRKGQVVDYFLILWDIVEWCKREKILTGVGRGSAAGCLVAYLLDITGIDPLQYGLLFERFLNEGRVQTSLPDIDTDFEGRRRDEVKRYMEEKYGINYVCSVGTYGTFKLKSAIKDLGRYMGLAAKDANYITSKIGDDGRYASGEFFDMFKESTNNSELKRFMIAKPAIFESCGILLKQPKTASVHPCATLILPKEDQHGNKRDIFSWIPVKKVDGVLVSEWEGGYLEDAGFLKEDILGIKQLDKFREIFNKISKNRGIDLDISSVDLEDERVYELFRKGLSADVFHFGSKGLTGYAQEVQPITKEEMIAMISIYRPGPIESNAHTDLVNFKFGVKEPEFDYMLENVTKETYGLYIYQEQVMLAVQQLGGMDLVTADDVRKAMGKMSMSLIQKYRVMFVEGAVSRGCDEVEAETIWNKLEAFARYGFNKSHAAAYTYTGIMCQWLKVNYPIEFWTTSFEFAEDKEIPRYISELSKLNCGVSVVPPNVNKSYTEFISDYQTGRIYWAINKIKWVGDQATNSIITEREKNGDFFSIEEFYSRIDTSKVNKRVVEHLILAGCFDEMYNIDSNVKERESLLQEYYKVAKIKVDQQLDLPEEKKYNWYWTIRQKEISGLGHFDFKNMILRSELQSMIAQYLDPIGLQTDLNVGKRVVVAGIIVEKITRKTKKGDEFCSLVIESNDERIYFLLWADIWSKYKQDIESSKTNMFIGSGTVHVDNFKKCNVLQSDRSSKIHMY